LIHCRNHLSDKASKTPDIAGGIDGIAKSRDHQMLRRQDDDALAEIT
jgi:hypothetical protein